MGSKVTSIRPSAVVCAPGDVHTPGANTAAVVTYAADASGAHMVSGIAWSYSGADPTGGNLKIEDGAANVVFSMDITSAGAGFIQFDPFKKGTANTALIVTLAAGGGSATGKVSVLNHWVE